ncbi:MAG: hypothetical protein WAJ93_19590 [Candidatus Nitrosopolaris sp.]
MNKKRAVGNYYYRITGTQFPFNNTPSSILRISFSMAFGRGILIPSIIIGITKRINNSAIILHCQMHKYNNVIPLLRYRIPPVYRDRSVMLTHGMTKVMLFVI